MTEHVKIGSEYHRRISKKARRTGMSLAEMCRRAIDLYTAVLDHPVFWRLVQKLNGRKLSAVIIDLLILWAEDKVVLEGDQQ